MNFSQSILLHLIVFFLPFQVRSQGADIPVNKYNMSGFKQHKQSVKGFTLSIAYAPGTQFLNPVFADSRRTGQLASEGGLSACTELSIFYPLSFQLGIYSETFRLPDNALIGNLQGSRVKIDNEYMEAFICSQLLPSKSIFLPYVGVGYLDGGLKLRLRDDKKNDVLAAVKLQSPAWKIGLNINVVNDDSRGKIGIMLDYMQPFKIDELLPDTYHAFNRFQAGVFVKFQ